MGYGVHVRVDADALTAAGRRLSVAAETLEAVAARVRALCVGAGTAAGGGGLDELLAGTGREAARALGRCGSAARELGTRTALAGEDYHLLEQVLASRWTPDGGAARLPDLSGAGQVGPGSPS